MRYISDFVQIRPKHLHKQEEILEWSAKAHAQFQGDVRAKLREVGLGPDKAQTRGIVIDDLLHENWEEMVVFSDLSKRMECFEKTADALFESFYPPASKAPHNLIHVSCTGYVSPSGAQKVVSSRGWGSVTNTLHAYHMGCYAAIPSLRIASGLPSSTDIVHTEMCSLHMNPTIHTTGQLVIHSLFGDGAIKYTVCSEKPTAPHFEIQALREEIVPDSTHSMSWRCAPSAFDMFIAKDIPVRLARALPAFLSFLSQEKDPLFAIHPGGPKIIEQIAGALHLRPAQYAHSLAVLRQCGNMSSATLPHIWHEILNDAEVPTGTSVVSLAFGPGLTIAGALLTKRTGK